MFFILVISTKRRHRILNTSRTCNETIRKYIMTDTGIPNTRVLLTDCVMDYVSLALLNLQSNFLDIAHPTSDYTRDALECCNLGHVVVSQFEHNYNWLAKRDMIKIKQH